VSTATDRPVTGSVPDADDVPSEPAATPLSPAAAVVGAVVEDAGVDVVVDPGVVVVVVVDSVGSWPAVIVMSTVAEAVNGPPVPVLPFCSTDSETDPVPGFEAGVNTS
jgi:hypothetical protein